MRVLGLAFVTAFAMFGAQSSAQSPQASEPQKAIMSKEEAARVMRMVMTIQSNHPFGKAHFGLLEEVMAGVQLEGEDPVRVDDHTYTYRGYTIRMIRSATRQQFSLTLVPTSGLCAPIYFGNETLIIYSGQAIGCPTT